MAENRRLIAANSSEPGTYLDYSNFLMASNVADNVLRRRGVGLPGTPYNFDRRQNSYSTDIGHAPARAQMQNEPPMQILNVVYAATISYTMYAR